MVIAKAYVTPEASVESSETRCATCVSFIRMIFQRKKNLCCGLGTNNNSDHTALVDTLDYLDACGDFADNKFLSSGCIFVIGWRGYLLTPYRKSSLAAFDVAERERLYYKS